MSTRTILLIDYDPGSIESAVGPLTEAGFRVEVAHDGVSGLEAFERLQPDLVLIEPMVPKKHGFEVCQEIKESPQGQGVPVLITTGFYRGRKHRLEATQYYGCDEYLEKPVSAHDLVAACSRLLPEPEQDPEPHAQKVGAEAASPVVAWNVGQLPDLTKLSEEEIVARLDALITEDPQPTQQTDAEASAEDEAAAPSEESIGDLPEDLSAELIAELAEDPESVVEAESAPAANRAEEPSVEAESAAPEPEPREGSDALEITAEERSLEKSDEVEVDDEEPEIEMTVGDEIAGESTPRSATAAAGVHSPTAAAQPQTSRVLAEAEKTEPAEATRAQARPEAVETERAEPSARGGSRKWVWISAAAAATVLVAVAVVLALVSGQGGPATTESVAQVGGDATPPALQQPTKRLDPQAYLMGPPEPVHSAPPAADPLAARATTRGTESAVAGPAATTQVDPPIRTAKVERTPAVAVKAPADGPTAQANEIEPREAPTEVAGSTAPVASAVDRVAEESAAPPAQESAPTSPVVEEAVAEIPDEGHAESFVEATGEMPAQEPADTFNAPVAADPPVEPLLLPATVTTPEPATAVEEAAPEPEPVRPKTRPGALVEISAVDTGPSTLEKAPPEYPMAARNLRLEGTVVLRVLVDDSGKVAAVETVPGRAAEVLVNAAVRAARGWTYRPATKDGVPVKVWLIERVSFKR